MERKKTLIILATVISAILVFPVVMSLLHLGKERPLDGSVVLLEKPVLSLNEWVNGTFQEKKEKYLNENFTFRNFCVRSFNQIYFSLFSEPHAKKVLIGKDDYLFEDGYVNSALGLDSSGEKAIMDKVNLIQQISDSITAKGATFLLVIAPGKGQFFEEYLPQEYLEKGKFENDYTKFIRDYRGKNFNLIDLNRYFLDNKNKSKYPLFSKFGIHWSYYGAYLASDSIISFLNKKNNTTIFRPALKNIKLDKAKDIDFDIGAGLNLLFDLPRETLAYPEVTENINPSDHTRPNLLVISDSFYWQLYNSGFGNSFNSQQFWYYYQTAYPEYDGFNKDPRKMFLPAEIKKDDIVIVLSTEKHIQTAGWDFFDIFKYHLELVRQLDKYSGEQKATILKSIYEMNHTKEWNDKLSEKAIKQNLSVPQIMINDAIWMMEQEEAKKLN